MEEIKSRDEFFAKLEALALEYGVFVVGAFDFSHEDDAEDDIEICQTPRCCSAPECFDNMLRRTAKRFLLSVKAEEKEIARA